MTRVVEPLRQQCRARSSALRDFDDGRVGGGEVGLGRLQLVAVVGVLDAGPSGRPS